MLVAGPFALLLIVRAPNPNTTPVRPLEVKVLNLGRPALAATMTVFFALTQTQTREIELGTCSHLPTLGLLVFLRPMK